MEEDLKVCVLCKLPLPLYAFNKNKRKPDGLQDQCRECGKKKSTEYYNSNKEKHKKVTVERNKKNRIITQQFVYDFLKKTGCASCPENDPAALDFDHQRDKRKGICEMVGGGCSISTIMEEISKCQILCANCHRKKTAKDFDWYKNINTGL